MENKNYGFIKDEFNPEDYVFGAAQLPEEVLMLDGDWSLFLPQFEHQRKNIETMACVSFGTNSALEMLHKALYGTEPNYSDRYIAQMSSTTRQGNSPRKVADTIRKIAGEVNEKDWPFAGNTWDDYYRDIPDNVAQKGFKWLSGYKFGYEWVKQEDFKKVLPYSPIGVAVHAWAKNSEGQYERRGGDNHYCLLIRYDEQDRMVIFDTYEQRLKTLTKDYQITIAMRYHLEKIVPINGDYKDGNWWFVNIAKSIVRFLKDWGNGIMER